MADAFTARELAELVGLSPRAVRLRATREEWPSTTRETNGGIAHVFDERTLPADWQVLIASRAAKRAVDVVAAACESDLDVARTRLNIVANIAKLVESGVSVRDACARSTASEANVSARTARRWFEQCRSQPREQWLSMLVPNFATLRTDCHPHAYAFFRSDYLRAEKPGFRACYRRTVEVARDNGWEPVPSLKTMMRRLTREVPREQIILARDGAKVLERYYPSQERTRDHFGALGAVNADGHKVDVLVRMKCGTVGRVMLVAYQDLYSGKILAWRVDVSENANLARLALSDLVHRFGIPDEIFLDNGRAWASKGLTGGACHRYRFKIRDDDPTGILQSLGVKVHFTTPYHGQAKPIERAFRDLCENVAKHPAFAGAYTGSTPVDKPHNYGKRAIELDEFLRVLDAMIVEHNERAGRTARVCNGRSFDVTFAESYATRPIRKLSDEQSRFLLLSSQAMTVRSYTASLHYAGNTYWCDRLVAFAGERVIARFDPDHLHKGLHVYTIDGRHIGFAECQEKTGFSDQQAARSHMKRRRDYVKRIRKELAEQVQFTPDELAEMHLRARGVEAPPPSAKVVKPMFNAPKIAPSRALEPTRAEEEREQKSIELLLELGKESLAELRPRRSSNG